MRILPLTECDGSAECWRRGARCSRDAERVAARIIADVRRRGDRALFAWTKRLDRVALDAAERVGVARGDGARRAKACRAEFLAAVDHAARNIRAVARRQKPQEWTIEVEPGVRAGQRVRAIDSVGCYLPGGRFSLVSTLLMTVIPAQEAGVRRDCGGQPAAGRGAAGGGRDNWACSAWRAWAARRRLRRWLTARGRFRAWTKIFGPGNRFVTAAKRLVSADCAIDLLAGPTEALVFADAAMRALSPPI